jgi:hypothetical protein
MKKYPFIISDNSINTKGFILLSEGIDFSDCDVMLYHHKDEMLPIGLWEDIALNDNVWTANAIFDQDDEFAVKVEKKVEKKLIKGCSVSVAPDLDSIYLNDAGVPVVAKSRAREISITPIGSNRNAIRLCDDSLNDFDIVNLSAQLKELATLPKSTKILETKDLAKVLNLADNATMDEIMAKAKAGEQASIELSTIKKIKSNNLAERAFKEGRITKIEQKQTIIDMADADYQKALDFVESLNPSVNLKDYAGSAAASISKEEEVWNFDDYSKKAPAKLAEMQKSDPERFKQLFKDAYGVEPKTK